jgi:glycosyltransferase involved in cell wall biosynthesis
VNTIPDALVFAAALPKLLGARIVIDMHECMPELFQAEHGKAAQHPMSRVLGRLEQWSMAFADQVVTCTDQQKAVFVARGTPASKIAVTLNCGDEALYRPQTTEPVSWVTGGPFRLITHGLVAERYGQDTLVRAVALLRDEIPDLALDVYGAGEYLPRLRNLVDELGVGDRVRLAGFVPHEELLAAIGRAHVGVVAAKRDVFRDLTHTNKMFEYALMRKPVVIAETSAVRAYFDDECFSFFRSADPADLARALKDLYLHPERASAMIERSSQLCQRYAWARQREIYRAAVLGVPTDGGSVGTLAGARTEA